MNALKILKKLEETYGKPKTALKFKTPFQLLVATILSAQCTDARVNAVTEKLFKKYSEPKDFASLKQSQLEKLIKSTGFYKNKAKNIIAASKLIVEKFNGKVPKTMQELILLPGVARKTANIVLTEAFGLVEGIAVDTHVLRLSQRLGFTKNNKAEKVELDLMKLFDKNYWPLVSNLLITHGRKICFARKPLCNQCVLKNDCPSAFKF